MDERFEENALREAYAISGALATTIEAAGGGKRDASVSGEELEIITELSRITHELIRKAFRSVPA